MYPRFEVGNIVGGMKPIDRNMVLLRVGKALGLII